MWLRALLYGLVGWAAEILWTALADAAPAVAHGAVSPATLRLEGRTYLWMLPIYGLGGLAFEQVARLLRPLPLLVRGLVYTAGIFAVEAGSGALIKCAVGVCPWDYTGARFSVGGLIRLDYAPLWFGFGLGLERLARALGALGTSGAPAGARLGPAWPTTRSSPTPSSTSSSPTFSTPAG